MHIVFKGGCSLLNSTWYHEYRACGRPGAFTSRSWPTLYLRLAPTLAEVSFLQFMVRAMQDRPILGDFSPLQAVEAQVWPLYEPVHALFGDEKDHPPVPAKDAHDAQLKQHLEMY
ncbi:hypothetical protein GOP47_0030816, partial [Adiantum capillus-veneris]